jgi:hypothetical protein
MNWRRQITYCTRCKSTIYWDDSGSPQLLQFGNVDLFTCMDSGCKLIFMEVPEQCCDMEELDLIRLGLQKLGIVEKDARLLALKLNRTAAAA